MDVRQSLFRVLSPMKEAALTGIETFREGESGAERPRSTQCVAGPKKKPTSAWFL